MQRFEHLHILWWFFLLESCKLSLSGYGTQNIIFLANINVLLEQYIVYCVHSTQYIEPCGMCKSYNTLHSK